MGTDDTREPEDQHEEDLPNSNEEDPADRFRRLTNSSRPPDPPEDGTIGIVDALLIAQYYVDLNPPGFNPDRADVNCDGDISITDALLIARYYVGLVTEKPFNESRELE